MSMSVVRGPLEVAGAEARDADPLAATIARAVGGDRAALGDLLRHVSPALLRGLRSMLGTADIDDALQESLLAFVDALPSYRGETNVRRYAIRIGIRTALAARRRERTRSGLFERHVEASEPLVPPASTPSEEALAARQREAFRVLLDEIPEAQAEALALRVVFECSLEEIATVTGAPINTIRSRVRLAREALRAKIEADPALRQLLEIEP